MQKSETVETFCVKMEILVNRLKYCTNYILEAVQLVSF